MLSQEFEERREKSQQRMKQKFTLKSLATKQSKNNLIESPKLLPARTESRNQFLSQNQIKPYEPELRQNSPSDPS